MSNSEQPKNWFMPIIISIVSSLIVGMASAYLTATVTLTRLEGQVDANRHNISRNVSDIEDLKKDRERMIRVETKIDILLGERGLP